ncbi:hypothetical protein [Burkholderia phage FLC9]|nr:hypothetical protein [Burkholderia phage FLC9]
MKIVYLRFGVLPAGGKSYNREKKKHEAGVGVWEAIEEDCGDRKQYRILLPRMKQNEWQGAAIELHGSHGKPVFRVTGRVLSKLGSFGEPLLADVQIVEEINPCAGKMWREALPCESEAADQTDEEAEGAYE